MIPWSSAQKKGERPSRVPFGGGECQKVVADDLSPTWRLILSAAPDGDFPRYGHLKVSTIFDSAVRRGFIEACGYHSGGQWHYRLTAYGRAVREALA